VRSGAKHCGEATSQSSPRLGAMGRTIPICLSLPPGGATMTQENVGSLCSMCPRRSGAASGSGIC
jgi:hypothetical protein